MPIGRVTTRSAGTAILWSVSLSRQASSGCGAGSRAQDSVGSDATYVRMASRT